MTEQEWLGVNNTLGIDIWHRKYQKNNETFDEWLDRVSGGNTEVRRLIEEKKFLFGGRILSNRGITGSKVSCSNCYVIEPPTDSIESIYDSRKKLARTYSYGGGCGIDLSNLAPAGAKVSNQAEYTSGAVSFMEGYSRTTEEIGQNGRRGALMISLSCTHPDLIDFINVKTKEGAVTKANISVRVSDDFMRAVENNEDWTMSFTRPETNETITKTMKAREIYHILCQNNSDWAEPGILYWDRIEGWNLLSEDENFHYAGVNPCAEEPLPSGGSCLLGSINLSAFVKDKTFDMEDFLNTVEISVKALNEVLDYGLPLHPLAEQRETVRDWRQIGLGVMGIADMLIEMEIPYDSNEAIKFCDYIADAMARTAIISSSRLAKEEGVFPKYNLSAIEKSPFLIAHCNENQKQEIQQNGLRNSQLLTIAPTGTLSTMLGISGGIEPIYANSYTRKTESLHKSGDVYYKVYTPIVKEYMESHGITNEEDLPHWFVTATTIDPFKRVEMQAAWQKHIDASISSTVNLPNEATVEEIEKLYMHAWKNGLKGMTIFRDGCSRSGVLSTGTSDTNDNKEDAEETLKRGDIINCSDNLIGLKRKIRSGCGVIHVQAWFDPVTGALQECFLDPGSAGGCERNINAISRLTSLCVRGGINLSDIIDQLNSVRSCSAYNARKLKHGDTSKGTNCPSAIGNALLEMSKEAKDLVSLADEGNDPEPQKEEVVVSCHTPKKSRVDDTPRAGTCPVCGAPMVPEGGCRTCKSCGFNFCET